MPLSIHDLVEGKNIYKIRLREMNITVNDKSRRGIVFKSLVLFLY